MYDEHDELDEVEICERRRLSVVDSLLLSECCWVSATS